MRVEDGFQFPALVSENRWTQDAALRATIVRHLTTNSELPRADVQRLVHDLHSLGERVQNEVEPIAATMNNPRAEPYLVQYDAWGKRIDLLVTSSGWKELKQLAAREGLVAESYDHGGNMSGGGRKKLGGCSRVYAFARMILFAPFSKYVLCPISMTDGAVRVLELYGTQAQKDFAIPHLVSADPKQSWTAGQFMTERPGGSDVSKTETTAAPLDASKGQKGDKFILNGFKWFSSATDGDIALALARTDPNQPDSSKGLSLFLVRLRDEQTGKLNGIKIHRLKNKMGTKYLPTAELELDNCVGELVGELGRGVATIASVLNITRLYSASGAISGLGKGLQIATSFAQSRSVMQSKLLSSLPLHTDGLLRVSILYRAILQLFFHNALLMGKVESGLASSEEVLSVRFLTPALKAFSATRASDAYVTLIESLGGQGYMEENGLSEMLRDLTVERIWEGTPAVLSLDLFRVLTQSKGQALVNFVSENLQVLSSLPGLIVSAASASINQLTSALHHISKCMQNVDLQEKARLNDYRFARSLLDCIMITHAGILLLQQAAWKRNAENSDMIKVAHLDASEASCEEDVEVVRLWVQGGIGDLDRNLANLESFTRPAAHSASLGQRLVYGSTVVKSLL
ncbi:hypothetical protein CBS101457_006097 [Exobasidium rhododendri]|nr:hypothetical protein CBS101457_006097 [Exobasidium rhododendri]